MATINISSTKNLDESYELVYQFHDVVKENEFSDLSR